MVTRGGSHYERTFMEAFIRPGPAPEDWIARDNTPALGVVPAGNREMFIYRMAHYAQPSSNLARYRLRADGFISVHAPYLRRRIDQRALHVFGQPSGAKFWGQRQSGRMRVEIQGSEWRPPTRTLLWGNAPK